VISRQKLVGWLLVLFAGGSLAYYLKTRLLIAGPPLERREWVQGLGLIGIFVMGMINIRMAGLRERRSAPPPDNRAR
jgi:hypothetical protein